jgi:hypothetical protein
MALDYLGNLHNISQHFNEPDGNNQMQEFENYARLNKNYAVKIHARHLFKFYQPCIIDELLNSTTVYRVKIKRKNIINQIASFYMAKLTNTWGYLDNNVLVNDVIIDISKIKSAIHIIKQFNKDLDEVNTNFDLELFYEDLSPQPDNCYKKTPRPSNYNIIIDAVTEHYYEEI